MGADPLRRGANYQMSFDGRRALKVEDTREVVSLRLTSAAALRPNRQKIAGSCGRYCHRPPRSDHPGRLPLRGADVKLYFGVGSNTDGCAVGADLPTSGCSHHPTVHDVPAPEIRLASCN